MTITAISSTTGSPFDHIRQTRADGTGYWSARDLMPLLGYGAEWRNFTAAIDRAKLTAQNQGLDPETLFGGVTEKSGGRPREDFHLSRYAAYLVAMNGDPRKPEVAAAQSYFAIRTREAEVTARPKTIEEMTLEVVGHLTKTVEDQQRQLEAAKPLAAHAITYSASARDIGRQEFAREVCKMLREQLAIDAKFAQVYDFLGRKLGLFIVGARRDSGQATAHGEKHGYSVTEKGTTEEGRNYATGKLTPRGQDYAWKRIYDYAAEHGTIALPVKENAA
ncbi:hypothetical protein [Brachybacterium hainanense]|uniref:Antirepressor protein C-terminal domain-containing protein n=1 Tax=Brachybacterium hainanense TaxID=1541174 RepID=A0ABV6R957_9MICO